MSAPEKPTDVFPARLRQARDLRKYSQSELGAAAGLPASSVAHFEGGNRKPSFDTLRNLANALNVTTDFLIGRTDNPAEAQAGDALHRHVANLSGSDRALAEVMLKALAERNKKSGEDD